MKKFTVKDFLHLNSPCFGCDGDIDIRIGVTNIDITVGDVFLKPAYALQHLTIPLVIKYNSNLKLIIDCKTNKFSVSDLTLLTNYLESHKLYLSCHCSGCSTQFISYHLEFNLRRHFIKPVAIQQEYLVLRDRKNKYILRSVYSQDYTNVTAFAMQDGHATAISNLELPIVPRYRFKDREQMMHKLRTYLLFS